MNLFLQLCNTFLSLQTDESDIYVTCYQLFIGINKSLLDINL